MRYGSVCSGIEAATAAWHPLGWEPAFFSEIEAFPRACLQHHYPDTQLHGDFTTIGAEQYGAINLLVGGTPCQSFSVAGLRKGLDDDRGNLALEFLKLAQRKRPTWLVWENVPGVLSSSGGRDFGAFLGGLVELGYGFSYRILDAQYFGVAQRRRRVFVVGHLGDWRCAAAVLFERHSLQGNPAPCRSPGKGTSHDVAPSLTASGRGVERCGETIGQDPVVATTNRMRGFGDYDDDGSASALKARDFKDATDLVVLPKCGKEMGVRRLTPIECERLQGFPDNFTRIPYRKKPADHCPDGPRYKALGNSMAVPVMRWIGERINAVEAITTEQGVA